MFFKKVSTLILIGGLAVGAASCANNNYDSPNSNATPTAQEVEKEDGSMVSTTRGPDGTVTEVRTFETGEVSRVTRTTPPNGRRTATVELRDGRKAELEDESDIENAMDATADAITAAATKTWDATKNIGEEAKDIGEKTVDVSKDVGSKVGKGAKEGAEKVGSAAKAVGKGAKKAGKKITGDGR